MFTVAEYTPTPVFSSTPLAIISRFLTFWLVGSGTGTAVQWGRRCMLVGTGGGGTRVWGYGRVVEYWWATVVWVRVVVLQWYRLWSCSGTGCDPAVGTLLALQWGPS